MLKVHPRESVLLPSYNHYYHMTYRCYKYCLSYENVLIACVRSCESAEIINKGLQFVRNKFQILDAWKIIRKNIFQWSTRVTSDDFICQGCRKIIKTPYKEFVHHIESLDENIHLFQSMNVLSMKAFNQELKTTFLEVYQRVLDECDDWRLSREDFLKKNTSTLRITQYMDKIIPLPLKVSEALKVEAKKQKAAERIKMKKEKIGHSVHGNEEAPSTSKEPQNLPSVKRERPNSSKIFQIESILVPNHPQGIEKIELDMQ